MAKWIESPRWPRLRIVSDGFTKLQFLDSEGNEVLKGCVRSVTWKFFHDRPAQFSLELLPAALEAEGEVREVVGEIKSHDAEEP